MKLSTTTEEPFITLFYTKLLIKLIKNLYNDIQLMHQSWKSLMVYLIQFTVS